MSIHKNIKKLRKLSGLKQQDVADLLGTGRANYNHKENGKSTISAEELIQLLAIFKEEVDPEVFQYHAAQIFGGTGKDLDNLKPAARPTPIDPITEAVREYLQETGQEITPENAAKAVKILKNWPAEDARNVTPITKKHQEKVKDFEDKEEGYDVNCNLIKLEKLDVDEFYKATGRIRTTVKILERKKTAEQKKKQNQTASGE